MRRETTERDKDREIRWGKERERWRRGRGWEELGKVVQGCRKKASNQDPTKRS